MPEGHSFSLVNLGDSTKPADTLIKKVSKAVGGIFAPYQITRVAKAKAKAAIIRTQAEIEITDLQRRAMHRFIEEQAQRQANMESITAKALPLLSESATPDGIEDDWVTNFFDKSRIVSNVQMQDLWSRVLAGEANAPGTYSKRTVNFLADLDKSDAELFSQLCGFAWTVWTVVPLVFDVQADIYNRNGITFKSLSHLESIGLIQFNSIAGFARLRLPKNFMTYYYGRPLRLEMTKDADNRLEIGKALLTKTGEELAPICGSRPVDDFWKYVKDRWKQHLPKTETEQGAAPNGDPTIPIYDMRVPEGPPSVS